MSFLICFVLAFVLAACADGFIKRNARALYVAAAAVAVTLPVLTALGIDRSLPEPVRTFVWNPLVRGSLSTALFMPVMFAGALPNRNSLKRKLMSVRAELSILAGILTLGHNLSYGQTHFVQLFTDRQSMPWNMQLAAVCSLILIALLLPLLITSFPAVRKKMKPKRWKKLQRLAYGFYALIYVHVVLVFLPSAAGGNLGGIMAIATFSVIFLTYAAMRLRRAMKHHTWIPVAAAGAAGAVIAGLLLYAGFAGENRQLPAATHPSSPYVYEDGVYEGEGRGYSGLIRVRVTVSDGWISEIEVLQHREDRSYWEKAVRVLEQIQSENTDGVDTVSGATLSSRGLIEAARDALAQAQ